MKKRSRRFIKSNRLPGLMLIIFCIGLLTDSLVASKSAGLGLEAGYVLLSEDNFGKTPALGLKFFYFFSKKFRVELKGAFFPIQVEQMENHPERLSEGNLNMIPIQLSLQYCFKIGQRFMPYLGVGAGYYLNMFSNANEDEWQNLGFNINEEVDDALGFHFSAGLDYLLKPNMAFNIEVRYCIANLTGSFTITEEVSGISHSADIEGNLNHILFAAGIQFLF